jgi:hypothetical protein
MPVPALCLRTALWKPWGCATPGGVVVRLAVASRVFGACHWRTGELSAKSSEICPISSSCGGPKAHGGLRLPLPPEDTKHSPAGSIRRKERSQTIASLSCSRTRFQCSDFWYRGSSNRQEAIPSLSDDIYDLQVEDQVLAGQGVIGVEGDRGVRDIND